MIATKIKERLIYTREHWTEFFAVIVSEGQVRPRFYLPTHRIYAQHAYVVWIFPLAFLVILYRAFHFAFVSLWHDILAAIELIGEKV